MYSNCIYRCAEEVGQLKEIDESLGFEISQIDRVFSSAAWGWLIREKQVPFLKTDRFGSHLNGQMYTSSEFPWPFFGDKAYLPKIQLDLDKVSEYIKEDVGSGLLQLYEGDFDGNDFDDWYILRHIPRKKVTSRLLTDIPEGVVECEYSRVSNIQAFGKKVLRGDFIQLEDFELGWQIEDGLSGIAENYAREVARFEKSREKFVEYWEDYSEANGRGPTLFGFHDAIQSSASDFEDITLFDLDGATDIYGDGGGCIRLDYSKSKRRWVYDFYGDR